MKCLKLNPKITREELADGCWAKSANTIKEHLSRFKSEDRVEPMAVTQRVLEVNNFRDTSDGGQ